LAEYASKLIAAVPSVAKVSRVNTAILLVLMAIFFTPFYGFEICRKFQIYYWLEGIQPTSSQAAIAVKPRGSWAV
jgi:hypothetical protein